MGDCSFPVDQLTIEYLQSAVYGLATVRCKDGHSPNLILDFILSLLESNDNSSNKVENHSVL